MGASRANARGRFRVSEMEGKGAGASGRPGGRPLVLIIEDERDTADSLAALLRLEGFDVEVAYTGADGLRATEQAAPDVVLLDLGLPGMDGYEVAARLRARADDRLPIVALTGYATAAHRRLSAEVGIDLHLAKPADPGRLLQVLRGLPLPGTRAGRRA